MDDPEVIAAIIALGGVVLSVLVSILFHIGTTRYNYNQLFAQTVSNNRMDWINVWRANISKFLACTELLIEHKCECKKKNACEQCKCDCKDCKIIEYKKEFYESRGMITSRLNMEEELHILMFAAINQIHYDNEREEFISKREYILELERKILKNEWERVKDEARGKRK